MATTLSPSTTSIHAVFTAQVEQGYWDYVLGNDFDAFQAKEAGYVFGWEHGKYHEW